MHYVAEQNTKLEAKKAVILTRVSSKEQEEGYSIEAQKHRLQNYCARRDLEVLRVFEITESSTTGDRKKFMEMIKFSKSQRQPIAIIADKVDRVQRSFKEYPLLDALVQSGKIELHFITENYVIHRNSLSQERLMWSFGVIMAQSYVDSLRDNVKRSIDQKIRMGEYPSKAPVGYLNTRNEQGKSNIIIDPVQGHLVQKIFTEFSTGIYTISHIAEKAKEWGLRNKGKNNKVFCTSHLHCILTNPFYYGIMQIKGKKYPHRYERLIEKTTFDRCQTVLKSWNKKPFKYGAMEFAFRGLLTAASTGRTVSSFTKKRTYKNGSNAEWTYLQSWNREGKLIYIREEKVLAQAAAAFSKLKLSPEAIESVKNYLQLTERTEKDYLRRQAQELTNEQTRLNSRMEGLMDLLMDNAITREEYDRRRASISERQDEIKTQLNASEQGNDGFKEAMQFFLNLCNQAEDLFKKASVQEQRVLLNAVLLNLTLDNETLCYSYKIPFSNIEKTVKTGEWWELVEIFRTLPDLRSAVIDFYRTYSKATQFANDEENIQKLHYDE